MAHGDNSKAKLTATFEKRMDELRQSADTQAEQFRDFKVFRKWCTPEDLKEANLYDTPGMHSPTWDRNEINEIYSQDVMGGAGEGGGTTSGQIAMKLQCDFMAAEERAWRLRHANLVRAAAAAHGRLKAQGTKDSSIFDLIKDTVDRWIRSGASDKT